MSSEPVLKYIVTDDYKPLHALAKLFGPANGPIRRPVRVTIPTLKDLIFQKNAARLFEVIPLDVDQNGYTIFSDRIELTKENYTKSWYELNGGEIPKINGERLSKAQIYSQEMLKPSDSNKEEDKKKAAEQKENEEAAKLAEEKELKRLEEEHAKQLEDLKKEQEKIDKDGELKKVEEELTKSENLDTGTDSETPLSDDEAFEAEFKALEEAEEKAKVSQPQKPFNKGNK